MSLFKLSYSQAATEIDISIETRLSFAYGDEMNQSKTILPAHYRLACPIKIGQENEDVQ